MTTTDEISAEALLEKFFNVVLEEAKTNKRFAESLIEALPQRVVVRIEVGRKKSTKPTEPPVSLTRLMNREGEDELRSFLKKRNKPQLLKIAERQQIPLEIGAADTSNESLRNAIVDGVKFKIADRIAAAS